jgi:lysozyme
MTITRAHGEALLDSDMAVADEAVRRVCPTVTEHQRWALVSLAFNIGGNAFAGSTVARLHARGDYEGAARAFSMWNKATVNGRLQEVPGLTRRRAAETAFYLTPDEAEKPLDMPQAVEPPKTTSKTVVAGSVSVAAGVASIADQIDQVKPLLDGVATAGASVQSIAKLGAVALSVIALAAVGYMLVRYIIKARRGDVVIR